MPYPAMWPPALTGCSEARPSQGSNSLHPAIRSASSGCTAQNWYNWWRCSAAEAVPSAPVTTNGAAAPGKLSGVYRNWRPCVHSYLTSSASRMAMRTPSMSLSGPPPSRVASPKATKHTLTVSSSPAGTSAPTQSGSTVSTSGSFPNDSRKSLSRSIPASTTASASSRLTSAGSRSAPRSESGSGASSDGRYRLDPAGSAPGSASGRSDSAGGRVSGWVDGSSGCAVGSPWESGALVHGQHHRRDGREPSPARRCGTGPTHPARRVVARRGSWWVRGLCVHGSWTVIVVTSAVAHWLARSQTP